MLPHDHFIYALQEGVNDSAKFLPLNPLAVARENAARDVLLHRGGGFSMAAPRSVVDLVREAAAARPVALPAADLASPAA